LEYKGKCFTVILSSSVSVEEILACNCWIQFDDLRA